MYNRRPQQPPPQRAQPQQQSYQFRSRAPFPNPARPPERLPQGTGSFRNPSGFTPSQRMTSSSGPSSHRVLTSGDSGVGSYNHSTSSLGQNSNRNQSQQNQLNKSNVPLKNVPAPAATSANDFDLGDDVWGDDDDDMDMFLASQAVEAATPSLRATNAAGSTVLYSSQPPSSLNQHGVRRDQNMPLHMIRYELALKESKTNGEEVRMEDFMTDGVLGGVIASSTSGIPKEKSVSSGQQIAELKKVNEELKSENYSCKGEVANLRRLLEKNQKERQKEMVNRVNQEKDKQKMEKEEKDRASKDVEKIKTDLRYKENDVRDLSLRIGAYKKQIESLSLRLSSQIGSLPNASASVNSLGLNSSRTSSSNSFPNRSSFHSRETPTPVQVQLPSLSPIPTVKIECKTINVQTDQTIPPETANDVARKAWTEAEHCRQLILSVYLERIIVKTSKDTALLIPVFESIADKAQNEIILNLKNEGFRYEFMFPDNLKLAEFKLDEKERNLRNKTKPIVIPKLPIEYKDWDGIDGLDVTIRNCLLQYQGDIWAGISHVGEDLIRRINFMRQGNPNSLYQSKNFVHFMKLLIWGRHLWKSFYPSFCQHWKTREEPRQFFLEDIKKWTACVLWIGNRCFEVVDARTELRKLVLKILVSLAKNSYSCFHYTEANYLGVYKFIFYTLTINRHLNFENFYRCLQLSGALGRKKFYLKYMCVNRKDKHACLAYQFATLGLEFFTKEKDISKKFKLYKAYLDLLDAMREWCVVHPQCAASEDTVQTDDPDSSTEHAAPVFVVRRKEVTNSGNVGPSNTNNENQTSRIDLDVHSFYHYGSEDFDTSISFIDLSDDSQLDRKAQELSKCKRATNSNHKVSNSEFPFKKPKVPPSSHWPPHLRYENVDDMATPVSSTKAIRGSPAIVSDFDCMMDVDPQTTTVETGPESVQSNFEVYEDEWDATEKEASTFKNDLRAENTSVSNFDLPCRKFLDCSLWEEMKDGPRVGFCQCRCRLMETFMRMTEEVIQFWRFLKICSEYKKSTVSSSEWEAEKREEDFEILLEKINNIEQGEEKRLGVVKSDDDFRDEHYISPELPFWKRLMRDVKYTPPKLTPECVGHALEKAVDIMSNSFITTQYNAFTAFGSDGANSFQVAVAYLLHYLSDLNFCPDTVRQVHYLSSSDTTGLGPQMNPPELEFMEGAHYSWAKNILRQPDHNFSTTRQRNPSGLSSFNVEFELENLPKFDPKNVAIVSRMPQFLVTSLLDIKQRKVEARKLYAQAAERRAFGDSGVDNISGQEQCDDVELVDISSPDPPHQEENEVEEENVEMQQNNAISSTVSESEFESEDDQNVSDEWLTTDESAEESDSLGDGMESDPSVLPPKQSSKYKVVDDFKSFCSPAVEDSTEFLDISSDSENDEGDSRFPTITFSRLSGYFQNKNKNQQDNNEASNSNLLCEYKSAQSICDELSNTANFNIKSPDLEGGILQDSDAVEENREHGSGRSDKNTNSLIQIAMATLNRRKYYCEDETRDLWDDYNVNPSRVDV